MPIFTEAQLLENIIKSKFNLDEEINLFCCLDDGYVNPTINLMYSIRHFCDRKINLYILTSKISKDSCRLLKKQLKYLNMGLWIKEVDFKDINIKEDRWTKDTYLKCFGFKYLPQEVEKALYIDGDVLAVKDISEFYFIDIEKYLLACTFDIDVNNELVFERKKNLNICHDYFNAGVMLLNLKKQRECWTLEMIVEKIKTETLPYLDKDLLNMICKEEEIKFLPFRFNYQDWFVLEDEHCFKVGNPTLIHFVSGRKPWKTRDFSKFTTKIFYECARLTHLPEYCPGEFFEDRLKENIIYSKEDGRDRINILCGINDSYVGPIITLMFSIRQYNKNKISLYIATTELSKSSIAMLKKKMSEINVDLEIYVYDKLPPDLYTGNYWSPDIYLRTLCFEYLPKDIDKILYIDGDTLAFGDIAEVFNVDISDYLLSARKEPWRFEYDKMIKSIEENKFDHEYCSSGVLLLNLKRIRNEWSREIIFNLMDTMKLVFPDQDIINKLCLEKDLLYMPDEHNYYKKYLMDNYDEVTSVKPIILHYPGQAKPWTVEEPNLHQEFWFKAAKTTGIEEYIEKANNFKIS